MAGEVTPGRPARGRARHRAATALTACLLLAATAALVAPAVAGGGDSTRHGHGAGDAAATGADGRTADAARAAPATGSAGTGTAAGSPATATGQVEVGTAPPVPPGARAEGPLAPSTPVALDVALQPSDPAALDRFVNQVSDPSSPDYRHYLARGQFATRFGPSAAATTAVRRQLARDGLSVGAISADGLLLHVSGTAAVVSSSLHVPLERYRLAGGRTGFSATSAPMLPAALSSDVVGISGLSDLERAEPLLQPAGRSGREAGGGAAAAAATGSAVAGKATGPTACAAAATAAPKFDLNTWTQIAKAYGFTAAYAEGDLGSGSTVGIFELEPYASTDLATFQSCFALPAGEHYGTVENVPVDGGAGAGAGSGEAILDVEDVHALAPETDVLMYSAPNTDLGSLDEYDQIVNEDRAQVISTSWGECESFETTFTQSVEDEIFQEAAAQGQTVFAAAGDLGSEDCHLFTATAPATTTVTYTKTRTTALAVDDPGSQPYVTSVGGTQLTLTKTHDTTSAEVVWNSDTGTGKHRQIAGAGGVSSSWAKPAWQATGRAPTSVPGPATGRCTVSPGSTTTSTRCRQVPDVSATADPTKGGDEIYCSGASLCTFDVVPSTGGWSGVGGTSDAAPLWAAFTALANESCGADVGFLNPRLYQLGDPSGDFRDITSGTNNVSPTHPGTYSAGPGYDNASGLGSPDGGKLLAGVCPGRVGTPTVKLSTPAAGAKGTYTVTFTATGTLALGDSVTLVGPPGTAFPAATADYSVSAPSADAVEAVAPVSTGSSSTTDVVTVTLAKSVAATAQVTVTIRTAQDTTKAGTYTLEVETTADSASTVGAPFTVVAGPVSATTSTVAAGQPSVPDNGLTADTVTVTVRDRWGNPVATAPVHLTSTVTPAADPDTVTPATSTPRTSADGTVAFPETDDSEAQVVYGATVGGKVTITQTATVNFTALSECSASLTPATAAATSTLQVACTTPTALASSATVTVVAPPGSMVPPSTSHYTVGLSAPRAIAVAEGPGSTTDNEATITLASAVPPGALAVSVTGVTNTARAGATLVALSTSADPVPADVAVTIVAGAPSAAESTVDVLAPSGPADGLSPDTVEVTVRDGSDNPVAGGAVALSGLGHATVTPPTATTAATGSVRFSLADATAETLTLEATAATSVVLGHAVVSFTGISALDYQPLTTLTTAATEVFTTGAKVDVEAYAQMPGPLGAGDTVTLTAPPGTSLPSTYTDYEIANAFGYPQAITRTITRSKATGSSTTNRVILTLASPSKLDKHDEAVVVAVAGAVNPVTPGPAYATISASGPGDTVPSSSQPIDFVVGPASKARSTVVATPTSVGVGQSSTVTVTVEDTAGNRLAGQTVSLSPSADSATVAGDGSNPTPKLSTTSPSGAATFSVSDSVAQAVSFTADDVNAGVGLDSTTVTFTAPHTTKPATTKPATKPATRPATPPPRRRRRPPATTWWAPTGACSSSMPPAPPVASTARSRASTSPRRLPSWAWCPRPRTRVTSWWGPTAGSSPSATPPSWALSPRRRSCPPSRSPASWPPTQTGATSSSDATAGSSPSGQSRSWAPCRRGGSRSTTSSASPPPRRAAATG